MIIKQKMVFSALSCQSKLSSFYLIFRHLDRMRWNSTGSHKKNAIFVAGTMQHHGKTTITLGLVHALLSRNIRLAYQKPVGQQTVSVECDGETLQVDRDVDVFKHLWPNLVGSYSDCSPVTFPPAFTRYVLDGKVTPDALRERCVSSFRRLQQEAEYVVVEGTGHIGVGTIVGLNNAQVYALHAATCH